MVTGKRSYMRIFAYRLFRSNGCRTAKSCVNRYFMLLLHIFPQSYPHSMWITLWENHKRPKCDHSHLGLLWFSFLSFAFTNDKDFAHFGTEEGRKEERSRCDSRNTCMLL